MPGGLSAKGLDIHTVNESCNPSWGMYGGYADRYSYFPITFAETLGIDEPAHRKANDRSFTADGGEASLSNQEVELLRAAMDVCDPSPRGHQNQLAVVPSRRLVVPGENGAYEPNRPDHDQDEQSDQSDDHHHRHDDQGDEGQKQ